MNPAANDGYHGLVHVLDFVSDTNTYTATVYDSWTNTSFRVLFGDVFIDQVDPNTGKRNFVQDDGSSLCPAEPLIRACENLYLGPYNIYVKAVHYGDDDSSNSLTCGDTIFEVEKSDPVVFELTAGPFVNKLNPWSISRAYYYDHDGNPSTPDVICDNQLTIFGGNFGVSQAAGDVVMIGLQSWFDSDPFTTGSGIVLPYVTFWDNTNIRVYLDKPRVPGVAVTYNDPSNPIVIWVIKNGVPTEEALPIDVLPDAC